MAKTATSLYRSVMGNKFKKITVGTYPGDGILDPRWEDEEYFSRKLNKMVTSFADVDVVLGGKDGPEVKAGGGTSLHDAPGWFPCKEFWIPDGTEYSEEIHIRKDAKAKKNPAQTVEGTHYQLEPKTRMTVTAFQGALNNMARAAVARQVELAKVKI